MLYRYWVKQHLKGDKMFVPYHKFKDCKKLEGTIRRLHDRGSIPASIYTNYCRYHFSVLNKLKSTQLSLNELRDTLSIDMSEGIAPSQLKEVLFSVNFRLDSFLNFCGSALDVFARDVLSYFDLIPPPRTKVYFETARRQIMNVNPNNVLLPKLNDPPWRGKFKEYRDCSTHEAIISEHINIETVSIGPEMATTIGVKLPDDPRSFPRRYNQNIILIEYCEDIFSKILRLFHPVYTTLNNLIVANGSLPLSP